MVKRGQKKGDILREPLKSNGLEQDSRVVLKARAAAADIEFRDSGTRENRDRIARVASPIRR